MLTSKRLRQLSSCIGLGQDSVRTQVTLRQVRADELLNLVEVSEFSIRIRVNCERLEHRLEGMFVIEVEAARSRACETSAFEAVAEVLLACKFDLRLEMRLGEFSTEASEERLISLTSADEDGCADIADQEAGQLLAKIISRLRLLGSYPGVLFLWRCVPSSSHVRGNAGGAGRRPYLGSRGRPERHR